MIASGVPRQVFLSLVRLYARDNPDIRTIEVHPVGGLADEGRRQDVATNNPVYCVHSDSLSRVLNTIGFCSASALIGFGAGSALENRGFSTYSDPRGWNVTLNGPDPVDGATHYKEVGILFGLMLSFAHSILDRQPPRDPLDKFIRAFCFFALAGSVGIVTESFRLLENAGSQTNEAAVVLVGLSLGLVAGFFLQYNCLRQQCEDGRIPVLVVGGGLLGVVGAPLIAAYSKEGGHAAKNVCFVTASLYLPPPALNLLLSFFSREDQALQILPA